MSQEIIIADSSCLIVLQNIQKLTLLKNLYGVIFITEEVKAEFGFQLPEWIKVQEIKNQLRKDALRLILDKGEASSIALALETDKSILIIDEKKGRKTAQDLGLKISGTLSMILKAKENSLIDSIENTLDDLENAGFYISQRLKVKLLENN